MLSWDAFGPSFDVVDMVRLLFSDGFGRDLGRVVRISRSCGWTPTVRRLRHCEEDKHCRSSDQSGGDIVDVPPRVGDGNETCNYDAA